MVVGDVLSTYCDDGNLVIGDGCNDTCQTEDYWDCSGATTTTKDTCVRLEKFDTEIGMEAPQASSLSITSEVVSSSLLAGASVMTGSYSVGMYAAMTQTQLLSTAMLSDAYIPEYTREYVEGTSFNMLSHEDMDLYDAKYGRRLDNALQSGVGVISDSAFVTIYLFLFLMVVVMIIHVILKIIVSIRKKDKDQDENIS